MHLTEADAIFFFIFNSCSWSYLITWKLQLAVKNKTKLVEPSAGEDRFRKALTEIIFELVPLLPGGLITYKQLKKPLCHIWPIFCLYLGRWVIELTT